MIVTQSKSQGEDQQLMVVLDRNDLDRMFSGVNIDSKPLEMILATGGKVTMSLAVTPDASYVENRIKQGIDALTAAEESRFQYAMNAMGIGETDLRKMN